MIREISRAAALAAVAVVVFLTVGPASAATPDPKLLARYQPVMRFDPAERFTPTSVQSFITDSNLERFDGSDWVVADPDPGPGDLPGPGTGAWRLNQDPCTPALPLGGLDCYAGAWSEDAGASVVYGRVARESDRIILQYWYFYYDDVYSYLYPPSGVLWQAHEGDWEVVNVVLSADEQPLFVGYSQHCLGQQRPWDDTDRWQDTHPIVYVAVGSHANYFDAGAHPFIPACVPPEVQIVLALLGLGPPLDYTGDGEVAGPPRSGGRVTHVLRIDESVPPWTAFAGFWGEYQFFHAPAPIGTVLFGTSPDGPAYHAVWTDPLATLAAWPAG